MATSISASSMVSRKKERITQKLSLWIRARKKKNQRARTKARNPAMS
jgi:hypothetical protein